MISTIIKRDGRQVPFDRDKIQQAIARAGGSGSHKGAETRRNGPPGDGRAGKGEDIPSSPTVEQVQDVVERVLIEKGFS